MYSKKLDITVNVHVVTHQVNSVSLVGVSQLPRNKGLPFLSVLCWELCATNTHTFLYCILNKTDKERFSKGHVTTPLVILRNKNRLSTDLSGAIRRLSPSYHYQLGERNVANSQSVQIALHGSMHMWSTD